MQQFHVTPDPAKMVAYKLTIDDLLQAIERNNANTGAGYIERGGEQNLIRIPGQVVTRLVCGTSWWQCVTGCPCGLAT